MAIKELSLQAGELRSQRLHEKKTAGRAHARRPLFLRQKEINPC